MPNQPSPKTAAIILVGGASRRMGIAKADLPVGPETMLARIVRLLQPLAHPVVLAAAANQTLPPIDDDVRIARDATPDQGPLEGLASALDLLAADSPSTELALAVGCDTPRISPPLLSHLAATLLASPAHAAVVHHRDRDYPLLATYRLAVRHTARELLAADRRRLRDLLAAVSVLRLPAADLTHLDPDLASLENLNTPADYFAALQQLGFHAPPAIRDRLAPP